jgi:hypothetical protein
LRRNHIANVTTNPDKVWVAQGAILKMAVAELLDRAPGVITEQNPR